MQFIHTLTLAFGLISAVAAAPATSTCNADNCLRQVRATTFPARSGTADCKAFQTRTSTVVSTVTSTVAAGAAAGKRALVDPNAGDHVLEARQATSTATIPAYASSCANPSQYASACRCAGVTAATSTVTSTSTVTVTTTSATCPTATYAIQQQVAGVDGAYGTLEQDFAIDGTSFLIKLDDDTVTLATAARFTFVTDATFAQRCRLRAVGYSGTVSIVVDGSNIFVDSHYLRITDPAMSSSNLRTSPAYCSRTAGGLLACTAVDSVGQAPDQTTLFNDDGDLRIGTASHAAGQTYKLIEV